MTHQKCYANLILGQYHNLEIYNVVVHTHKIQEKTIQDKIFLKSGFPETAWR